MSETGFGSPTIGTDSDAQPGDWGFGSPEPSPYHDGDTGFGSPFTGLTVEIVAALPGDGTFGDDGGYIVEVRAEWPVTGPYRFRLIDGADEYPETTYCYSAVAGQGTACHVANVGVDFCRFALPVAPPATYDLQIEWGDNYGSSALVVGAITIVTRNRAREVFAYRNRLPSIYKAGARTSNREPLSGFNGPPWQPMEALTMTLGRQLQRLTGVPMTRVAADFGTGDVTLTVETTLGFPDDGLIWLDGRLYTYEGRTATTFTGVATHDGLERTQIIGIKTQVLPYLPEVAAV